MLRIKMSFYYMFAAPSSAENVSCLVVFYSATVLNRDDDAIPRLYDGSHEKLRCPTNDVPQIE